MAERAVPTAAARLGRPLGDVVSADGVRGVVLLLPGGEAAGTRPPSALALAAARPLARRLARAGREHGLVAHVVHYRHRGWNADHPVADAAWAADEVARRYGSVPVCLAGTGMGARAALRAAGHASVRSVLALAPWLTAGEEPVKQLAGRRVLIAHGTDDERTDPELSYRLAERVKKINQDVCRFEIHTDTHRLRRYRSEIAALAADFALGSLFGRPFCRPVSDALAAAPPLGLRMPLAQGFGTTLHG
ncbi:dienelactone hydrolase [Streptomyces sp. TP-A0874]|uniref:dienelactone hydrolase n=1 Tax=Streptomyces sp. TP-A0874 TaxID=549819 RepID=UPI000853E1AC|nr:dienelactone hydrolase [Streptomyces sp. TP-A0874]